MALSYPSPSRRYPLKGTFPFGDLRKPLGGNVKNREKGKEHSMNKSVPVNQSKDSKGIRSRSILVIGVLVLLVVVVRPVVIAILSHPTAKELNTIANEGTFRASMSAVAIITFFGILWFAHKTGGPLALHKGGMRLAIAAAMVVTDLVLVTTVIYFFPDDKPSELASSFISQFNTIVGVVIAFYFTASAYVQVNAKDTEANANKEDENSK